MAAYVKQADQVVLILTKAEATALNNRLVEADQSCEDEELAEPINNSTAAALDRARRALSVACEPGSRSGASIQ